MQTTEERTMFTPKLKAIRNDISPEVEQSWSFSEFYIQNYLAEHAGTHLRATEVSNGVGPGETCDDRSLEVASLLATGRLEWLLRKTRPSLSGRLSERDVVTMLDCYQGALFFPDQFDSLASDLCDHRGIELDLYGTSDIAPLVDLLLDLSPSQRMTLADALEQSWHRGVKEENKSPKEFFATLGIELTD